MVCPTYFLRKTLGILVLVVSFLNFGFSQSVPIPTEAANISWTTDNLLVGGWGVYVSGNYAYVISYSKNSVVIYDISDLNAPVRKGSILNGSNGALLTTPSSIFVSGNYAYVTSQGDNALEIIDVTDPTAPAHAGSIVDASPSGALLKVPTNVYVLGNYAYVTTSNSFALEIVDVTNKNTPIHKGSVAIPGNVNGVSVSGTYAYVVYQQAPGGGLSIVDVSDPANPTITGGVVNGGGAALNGAASIKVSGNYAYIVSSQSGALEIIDITSKTSPTHAGKVLNGGGGAVIDDPVSLDLAISGTHTYAIIGNYSGSVLEFLDVTTPTAPVHQTNVSNLNVFNGTHSVFVVGNYVYVATNLGLEVLAIVDPPIPTAAAATSVTSTTFTASWNSIANTTGYQLDVSTDINFGGGNFVATYNSSPIASGVTAVVVSPLTAGSTYFYRVRAKNSNSPGVSANSNTISVLTVPATPSMAVATSVTETSFTANWVVTSGATNYFIDVASDATFFNILATYNNYSVGNFHTLTVTGLTGGTNYYYRVRSANASGSSDNPNAITVLTAPPAPVAAAATSIAQTSFTAKWSAATSASTYYLDVATDAGFASMVAGYSNVTVSGLTNYDVNTNLTINTQYFYRVRADNGTLSVNSNVISLFTAPAIPVAAAATLPTQSGFTANWSVVSGVTNYFLDVATDAAFTSTVPGYDNLSVASNSQSVTGLIPGGTYYYQVRAANSSASSPSSNAISQLLIPGEPLASAATSTLLTSFVANWAASTGASEYFIDVASDAAFASKITGYDDLSVGNVITFTVNTNITNNSPYYYRVRAVNATGTSGTSNVIALITAPTAPVATSATGAFFSGFTAHWNPVAGISNYFIDVATDAAFTSKLTGYNNKSVAVDSLVIFGLTSGTTYYYQVRSFNTSSSSASSNVISQATICLAPLGSAASPIGQTSFTAKWAAAVGATSYLVDVRNNVGTIVAGNGNLPASATSLIIDTNILSGTVYHYTVKAVNSAGTSLPSSPIDVLTLPDTPTAGPADPDPTQNSFNAKWSSVIGATDYIFDISTVGTDPATFASNIITNYKDKDAGSNTSFLVSGLTAGTTYYLRVKAANATGPSPYSSILAVTTSFAISETIAFPTGGTLADYRIVSVPEGTTAQTTLSDASFVASWRVMHFQDEATGNVDVRDVTKMLPGIGYWVNSNLNPAPTLQVAGTFTAQSPTLILKSGWNQIGNPLTFDVSWSDVLAQNNGVNGIASIGNLFTYNVPTVSATTPFQASDGLLAKGGGFVNNTNSNAVTLTVPLTVAHFVGRMKPADHSIDYRDISGREWFVPLTFKAGEMINDLGGIGMHPDASNSIDQYDAIALPHFFAFADLSSNHPEFFEPRFMRDVVTTAGKHDWSFSALTNSEDHDASISWDNSLWAHGEAKLVLFDATNGVLVDMNKQDQYAFTARGNHSIRIFYSVDGKLSPDISGIGQPYPNPFSAETIIPFVTSSNEESIQINLYDVTGKQVRVLVRGNLQMGYHEARWNGTDDLGSQVGAGIYIYRYTSSYAPGHSGKVILR